MNLMNILGWNRTPAQKASLKARRHDKRVKRTLGEYARMRQEHRDWAARQETRKGRALRR